MEEIRKRRKEGRKDRERTKIRQRAGREEVME